MNTADMFWVGASVLWFAFWPTTIWKVYKTKNVEGLSLVSWIVEFFAVLCSLISGVLWREWSIIVSMGVFLVLTSWLILLIVKYREKRRIV